MRSLRLSHEQIKQIMGEALSASPDEACGMIGGLGIDAKRIVPITNVAEQAHYHYLMDGTEQLKALKAFDAQDLDWLAVYHSHPMGKPHPSQEDVREAMLNTPNLIHVIIGLKDQQQRLQAWHIHDGLVDEVELLVGAQASKASQPASRLEQWAVLFAMILGIIILLGISFILLPPAPSLPLPQ